MRGKFVLIGLFLIVLFSLSAFALHVSPVSLQCGDCDGNHFVNIGDAYAAAKYAVGSYPLLEPQFSACNVAGVPGNHYNPEATVGSSDSLFISQYVVGRRGKLDCILDDPYVFTRYNGSNRIFLMEQDGSNQREVQYLGSGSSSDPAMNPDGKQIVFSKSTGGRVQLFTIPTNSIATDSPRQLTFSVAHHIDPVWSPDGREIAYSRQSSFPYYDLYVLNLVTMQERNLVNGSSFGFDFMVLNPEWSSDGSEIAFVVGPNSNSSNRQIYKIASSGGSVQQLTTVTMRGEIGWGLDGRIAFIRGQQPASLFTIDSMGGSETLLTNYPFGGSAVSWHRDGSALLFSHRPFITAYIDVMQAIPGASIRQLTTIGSDVDARH